MKIKFKRLHENATIPKQATRLSGGWDVTVTEIIKEADDFVICKLGFALGIPEGYKLALVPRSSLTKTTWILQNSPGLGDCDYTGEYQFRFRAIPTGFETYTGLPLYANFPFSEGERIGQVYLEEVIPMEFQEVDELRVTDRSDGGFGSTGL
jgi:dUTP pyrophosphatase